MTTPLYTLRDSLPAREPCVQRVSVQQTHPILYLKSFKHVRCSVCEGSEQQSVKLLPIGFKEHDTQLRSSQTVRGLEILEREHTVIQFCSATIVTVA